MGARRLTTVRMANVVWGSVAKRQVLGNQHLRSHQNQHANRDSNIRPVTLARCWVGPGYLAAVSFTSDTSPRWPLGPEVPFSLHRIGAAIRSPDCPPSGCQNADQCTVPSEISDQTGMTPMETHLLTIHLSWLPGTGAENPLPSGVAPFGTGVRSAAPSLSGS